MADMLHKRSVQIHETRAKQGTAETHNKRDKQQSLMTMQTCKLVECTTRSKADCLRLTAGSSWWSRTGCFAMRSIPMRCGFGAGTVLVDLTNHIPMSCL